MADLNFLKPTVKKNRILFEESPLCNFFCSLSCLNQELDGLVGWIPQIKNSLSEQALEDLDVFTSAATLLIPSDDQSIEEFFVSLRDMDPRDLPRKEHERWTEKAKLYLNREVIPSLEDMERDKGLYDDLIRDLFCVHDMEPCQSYMDKSYRKYNDPEGFREEMYSFLLGIWNEHYREEWNKVSIDVKRSVEAFRSIDYGRSDSFAAVKEIIDRDDIPDIFASLIEEGYDIVFVPSPHIGPYLLEILKAEKLVKIIIRARIPEGASVRDLDMERAEVYSQLASLADNTRLKIMRMSSEEDFITTQIVMDRLDLSQSSASRHLNQLTAAGFLSFNPRDRVKHYKLNNKKVDSAFKLLKDFLKA